jgi:hypothetical protein
MVTVTPTDMTGQSAVAPAKQIDTVSSVETVATPQEAPAPKQEDTMSPRLAALARQQKALRAQQRSVEEKSRAIEAQKQEIEQAKAWKQRLTTDPYGVFLEAGLTADQAATLLLNQPNTADQRVHLLEQEIKALKASQEQSTTKFDQVQKQQYEDAKKQIRTDVTLLVDGDKTFEAIKAMNAEEAVVELIEATFAQSNGQNLMTIEAAAQEVEDYLVDEALKFAKLNKVQSRLAPVPTPNIQKQQAPTQKQMPTLSNRMAPSTPSRSTDRERRERAILAFQNKL